MGTAAIGIGSNIGDAAANVEAAIARLRRLGDVLARSQLYRSAPWGGVDQPSFCNAAALVATALTPRELLLALQDLEQELGRRPTFRWGPRVIDLDILVYDELHIDEPDLIVPHPRLLERAFALIPLAEITPRFVAARDALSVLERETVALWGAASALP